MIGQTPTEAGSGDPSEAPEAPLSTPPADDVPAPEHGGRGGLDPTRYGDWEKNGRCIDF